MALGEHIAIAYNSLISLRLGQMPSSGGASWQCGQAAGPVPLHGESPRPFGPESDGESTGKPPTSVGGNRRVLRSVTCSPINAALNSESECLSHAC